MKQYSHNQDREQYTEIQIKRSQLKFDYCKVSLSDAVRYKQILERDRKLSGDTRPLGPILCLGTRNGREVDIFRCEFFSSLLKRRLVGAFETNFHGLKPRLPLLEAMGRCYVRMERLKETDVIGVELNPQGKRQDVWCGSFDLMPAEWSKCFGVVYSNAFDQSFDPFKTAQEWQRIARSGAYFILCFTPNAQPNETDPVGGLNHNDFLDIFGGRMVYFQDRASKCGYSEIILKM